MKRVVTIIGGGLAGSEAAWQLANQGVRVVLHEMRPRTMTKAHRSGRLAELVCSNSFRGAALTNAVGLLKAELRLWGSLIMESAEHAKVPAGGALAVDRELFSAYVDQRIRQHPLIEVREGELKQLPESSADAPLIVATGPLTSPALARDIERLTGSERLAFFDAISPILLDESLDHEVLFRQSRYDKGGSDDYLNVPLDREQYERFIAEVAAAEKYGGHEEVEADSIENLRPFEGCMPIEEMVARGPDTLRHGPLKPVGLTDPRTGKRPYAVLQLRQDDREARLWSMVGMQTRMKHPEQLRIFRSLPGLQNAEFVRLGSVHRNTFIDSPRCLDATLEFRGRSGLLFAGQVTGVEGYVESTAGGLVAGTNAARLVRGLPAIAFPEDTAIGSLMRYISDPSRTQFQPMNISFGLMASYHETQGSGPKRQRPSKDERREATSLRALESLTRFKTLFGGSSATNASVPG